MQTVLEMAEFIRQARKNMSDDARINLIKHLALNPLSGDLMAETGGVRKLRWMSGSSNKGKSGGVRVVYFYHNSAMPIFLLTVYPKSEKDNLTQKEKNILKKTMKQIVETYERGKYEQ